MRTHTHACLKLKLIDSGLLKPLQTRCSCSLLRTPYSEVPHYSSVTHNCTERLCWLWRTTSLAPKTSDGPQMTASYQSYTTSTDVYILHPTTPPVTEHNIHHNVQIESYSCWLLSKYKHFRIPYLRFLRGTLKCNTWFIILIMLLFTECS